MDKILRVVTDTNHIMSAILSGQGASAKLIDWLIPDSKQREKERIMNILHFQREWIEPQITLTVCADHSDDRCLECAVVGNADYLVTKSIRHFSPREYSGVKIVRIREFLNVLENLEKSRKGSSNPK